MSYDYTKSIYDHISKQPEFNDVWSAWVEACKRPDMLPDFSGVRGLIVKYTNAAEVLTHNEIDTYYAPVYKRIASDMYSLKDYDIKVSWR